MIRSKAALSKLWAAGVTLLMLGACGGSESNSMPEDNRCGPHGSFHDDGDGTGHCHCEQGYVEENGSCVVMMMSRPQPMPKDPTKPDCGAHGSFDGRTCQCDAGYTQTGLREARTCEAIPTCTGPDDNQEPNNLPAEAKTLPNPEGGFYACPVDPDWYFITVKEGDKVKATITFAGDKVDLDLFLYGPSSRDPRALSLEENSNVETASFVAKGNGTAGILIQPYGIGEGSYQLKVEIEAGEVPMCNGPGGACSTNQDCCSGHCHVGHCH